MYYISFINGVSVINQCILFLDIGADILLHLRTYILQNITLVNKSVNFIRITNYRKLFFRLR